VQSNATNAQFVASLFDVTLLLPSAVAVAALAIVPYRSADNDVL
jgi:hypothetical protein